MLIDNKFIPVLLLIHSFQCCVCVCAVLNVSICRLVKTLMVLFLLSLTDINRAIELLDKLQRTGEVPPQKLQALQRVLQSEFCNAVREVRRGLCCLPPVFSCDVKLERWNLMRLLWDGDDGILSQQCLFRCMSTCMKRWTSTAVLRSGPTQQLR